jgi:hypothetical protein
LEMYPTAWQLCKSPIKHLQHAMAPSPW